jgi:hypothetical protein
VGQNITTPCWAARLVAPGHDKVLPLEPEFIVSKGRSGDAGLRGHGGQALSSQLRPALIGTRCGLSRQRSVLSASAPVTPVLDAGGHSVIVCKPSSHPLIQDYLTGIELPVVD